MKMVFNFEQTLGWASQSVIRDVPLLEFLKTTKSNLDTSQLFHWRFSPSRLNPPIIHLFSCLIINLDPFPIFNYLFFKDFRKKLSILQVTNSQLVQSLTYGIVGFGKNMNWKLNIFSTLRHFGVNYKPNIYTRTCVYFLILFGEISC